MQTSSRLCTYSEGKSSSVIEIFKEKVSTFSQLISNYSELFVNNQQSKTVLSSHHTYIGKYDLVLTCFPNFQQ